MGQIITKLTGNEINETEFIDFENFKPPNSNEQQLYSNLKEILERSDEILEKLDKKSEVEDEHEFWIRKALTEPNEQTEFDYKLHFETLIRSQKDIYDYSLQLKECCVKLMEEICECNGTSVLEKESFLVLFCSLIAFSLKFDDQNMINQKPIPRGQSQYLNRTYQRYKLSKNGFNISVDFQMINRMNLFFAYPTPMMNVVNESLVQFIIKKEELIKVVRANVISILSFIANSCLNALIENRFQNENTNKNCMRVMTGSIILFDHIDEKGAFHKHSQIQIKKCISILKNFSFNDKEMVNDSLLNALRFTTIHLNDPLTPSKIKLLLD